MRLERLEIHGFKSFSDRSELAFGRGVTAIVGPNGCGKSNVADAITWVMGEQSARSLRGERMEDVIFNGSDARKPTASAEVRLRLSGVLKTLTGPAFSEEVREVRGGQGSSGSGGGGNDYVNGAEHGRGNGHGRVEVSDSDGASVIQPVPATSGVSLAAAEELIQSVARDVEVTRRLYRSGESEYLIDGQVCRLRDVHELLMDTGLGAKAYAIIEQGKIGLILSTRPTDRRQLIEEAAGVTKYKVRRRAAELKLEAAQQNVTRIDDIVFEVDKQCGVLKRQASKARRYQRLRDELLRWEKVLFARRYRQLAGSIEAAQVRAGDARAREAAAAAGVAEADAGLAGLRIELVEAESRAATAREAAHALELAIARTEQQLAFDREQVQTLDRRAASLVGERDGCLARREPARAAVAARRAAVAAALAERDRAAAMLLSEAEAHQSACREIEGLEADVEAARGEVFSAINSATALRHAMEHATAARDRVLETLSKLDAEVDDVRIESERMTAERVAAASALTGAQAAIDTSRSARAARESELASARVEHEWRARSVRAREQDLAALDAQLKSLEGLEASRAGYGDGARVVLERANGNIAPIGAVADFLDVEAGYERAVEACLGDVLQHVVVEGSEHAAAGFEFLRQEGAGRCGFLIASRTPAAVSDPDPAPSGFTALSSIVRVGGPLASAIRHAIGDAWIAASYEQAAEASGATRLPIATRDGDVFRGPHVVAGGGREDARGILQTKREIKELRERVQTERIALFRLAEETADLEAAIAQTSTMIATLDAERHRQEKAIVGHELQLQRASEEIARLGQKREQLARERRQAEEERSGLDGRLEEARASIVRLESDQQAADNRLAVAQRRLFEAREAAEDLSRRTADVGASHATLVERAAALAADVERLEEVAGEIEARTAAIDAEVDQTRGRVDELRTAVAAGEARLDAGVNALGALHRDVEAADSVVSGLRTRVDEQETVVRVARSTLESTRAAVAQADIARVTAEADLSHLATSCLDAVQVTLDEVLTEVEQLELAGNVTPDGSVILVDDPEEDREVTPDGRQSAMDTPPATEASPERTTAEDAIARLRAKVERLGPVNMMAIEQFDELEARHSFLTKQRKDLVDSISQTSAAIKRIDDTTRRRFAEAFAAINQNFQETFSVLFGGGRAGLALIDESDPLESGIEIIAQPPGKRLQSVQLLSGGEKALTAIALMFSLFKYKPSPFCLLDEIDAPLDDANIGRFVEMLQGMQKHTQFILITHNRKTMEIADRLYGITMEEPGVSKLISVHFN